MSNLPPWMFDRQGHVAWWYDVTDARDPLTQGLFYACSGDRRQARQRMRFWRCPKLEQTFASQDGYISGVRWNPIYDPKYPVAQHPLSVNRFLAALREAYDHSDPMVLQDLARLLGKVGASPPQTRSERSA